MSDVRQQPPSVDAWRDIAPLDPVQARRIGVMHGGYLYQHLYAVGCVLLALRHGTLAVRVEGDEDIELLRENGTFYLQVKTRDKPLSRTDVEGTLARAAQLRAAHSSTRKGAAQFYIIANVAPAPTLEDDIGSLWPKDVRFRGPGTEPFLPPTLPSVAELFAWCVERAREIPLRAVGAETLAWKLAAMVLAACADGRPGRTFVATELPELFEQVVIQLQRLPMPPRRYLGHANEPPVIATPRVRLIVAPAGAGKTTWAAHAGENSGQSSVYYDVALGQGGALASAITREIAAAVLSSSDGALSRVLLPGASGVETLSALARELERRSLPVTVLLDNAQRADLDELRTVVGVGEAAIRWVVLAQPDPALDVFEASLQIRREPLDGWSIETVATALASEGLVVTPDVATRVQRLTGSLPLFVREFALLAKERGVTPAALCDELESQTHLGRTRQEAILDSVLARLSPASRASATALALCEVPLQPEEVRALLESTLGLTAAEAAGAARDLVARAILGTHPKGELALLDAFRLALLASSEDGTLVASARKAIVDLLAASLRQGLRPERLLALLKLLPRQGETKAFLDIVSTHSEQIDELGLMAPIERTVRAAAANSTLAAEDRFWALDVVAFLARGQEQRDAVRAMRELVEAGGVVGREEQVELTNKLIAVCRGEKELGDARDAFARGYALAVTDQERLVLRYALASTCLQAGRHREAERSAEEIVAGYYALLGLAEADVRFKNGAEVGSKLKPTDDVLLVLKRLADAHALVAMARDALHERPGFARIDAMKFYAMAQAPVSAVRFGLDAVDDFMRAGDLPGARMVLDGHVESLVKQFGLADWIVPVASTRAVLLAHAGRVQEARALFARYDSLAEGLSMPERDNFERQRKLVEELARHPGRRLLR